MTVGLGIRLKPMSVRSWRWTFLPLAAVLGKEKNSSHTTDIFASLGLYLECRDVPPAWGIDLKSNSLYMACTSSIGMAQTVAF